MLHVTMYMTIMSAERRHAAPEAILDIIAKESRIWLLEGQQLIALVQSNDPKLELPKLGGISPNWNSAEWFNDDRV